MNKQINKQNKTKSKKKKTKQNKTKQKQQQQHQNTPTHDLSCAMHDIFDIFQKWSLQYF